MELKPTNLDDFMEYHLELFLMPRQRGKGGASMLPRHPVTPAARSLPSSPSTSGLPLGFARSRPFAQDSALLPCPPAPMFPRSPNRYSAAIKPNSIHHRTPGLAPNAMASVMP